MQPFAFPPLLMRHGPAINFTYGYLIGRRIQGPWDTLLPMPPSVDRPKRIRWQRKNRSGGPSPEALVAIKPGATLARLSRVTGVGRNTVSAIINGKTDAHGATWRKLARALHATTDELMDSVEKYAVDCVWLDRDRGDGDDDDDHDNDVDNDDVSGVAVANHNDNQSNTVDTVVIKDADADAAAKRNRRRGRHR